MSLNRVVITGLGAVTPIGYCVAEMMDAFGRRGVRHAQDGELESLWAAALPGGRAGGSALRGGDSAAVSPNDEPDEHFRRPRGAALQHAGLAAADIPGDARFGCVMGSTTGSPDAITDAYGILFNGGYAMLGAAEFFRCVAHTVALNVAQFLSIKGVVMATCAASPPGSRRWARPST